ncbi:hypothetical protein Ahy_A03g011703 [Arachis hypogaea]|uniref:FAD-binding PCMH-type domain-containing protein n=1 Tax=Arachis hypogaea TaxID=3818 RepID=A0A445DRI5_ARAHY|nr:hypothetical protein Ahy_A03g011703 [Arachis hypogaea]
MVTSSTSSLSFLLLSTLLAPTIVLLLQSSVLHANPDAYFHTCLSNKRWKNPSAPVSVTGALYTRDNSSFFDILSLHTRNKRFNRPYTPKPIAIITPFHESHIQAAVVCSKDSNFQLRIRSGGHDYEGYSYVSDVPFVLLDMTLEQGGSDLVYKWQHVAPNLHRDIFIRLQIEVRQKTVRVSFVCEFLGRVDRLLSLMEKSFPELGLTKSDCFELPWVNSTLFFAEWPMGTVAEALLYEPKRPAESYFKGKSDYVQKVISKEGLQSVWKKFIESEVMIMEWNPYGGRMWDIPASATPFPHRTGNLFQIQYMITWYQDGEDAINHNFNILRSMYKIMTPFVSKSPRQAYLNYRDRDIGANPSNGTTNVDAARIYGAKFFKENFDKLVQVKTKVDPENFFRYEQTLTILLLQSPVSHANPDAYFHACLSNNRWKNPSAPVSVTGALYTRHNSSFSYILNLHIRNKRFNRPNTPEPIAIITPFHESHVQAAIICSKASKFQLRIRSGGHDYEGFSFISDVPFVLLDMYTLKSIHVNIQNGTALIEAGVTDLVYKWQHVAPKIDRDLFIRLQHEVHHKRVQVTFIAEFLGRTDRLLSLMKKNFPELGLTESDCVEMPWVNSTLFYSEYPIGTPAEALLFEAKDPAWSYSKSKSDYVKNVISKKGLQSIWNKLIESEIIIMQWSPYGGRMWEIPTSATPFPHRAGNLFKISYYITWLQDEERVANHNLNLLRSIYKFMTPFVSKSPREAFFNYRDRDIGACPSNGTTNVDAARIYGAKFFRENFDRLVQVKTRVDPENFFRYEQSIPPHKG